MAIAFQKYPSSNRVPGVYAEIDPSQANTAGANLRALIIGQITAAGAATPNQPLISAGVNDAITQGGPGSMLALMTAKYRSIDTFGEVWYLPLADDPAAVAATGTLTVTAGPTAAGTIPLYIAGVLVPVLVTSGMTPTQVAAAIATAIGNNPNLPVTASASSGVVTLTAKNKGLAGNDIDLRFAYLGATAGEVMPASLAITVAAMSGGAQNPTALATALANLADMPFEFIACPYNDTASLDAIKAFMDDNTGRWSWQQMLYGEVFGAFRGTLAQATTFGVTRNDPAVSIIPFSNSPEPYWLWAAGYTATCAVSQRANPALPLTQIPLGVLAPPVADQFTLTERNTLLYDGLSTFTVADDGTVLLERAVTTYQKNGQGQPDDSYLDVETRGTLAYVCRDLKTYLSTVFARKILVSDQTRIPAGSDMVNPSTIKAAVIARYYYLQDEVGIVQNADTFAKAVQVQNAGNGLVQVLWPGDLANQLRQIAILVQFQKT